MKIKPMGDFFTEERIDQAMSALVTLETLEEFTETLLDVLKQRGYHHLQSEEITRINRELMEQGMAHSPALKQAMEQVGQPARRRTIFWDEQLEQRLKAGG